MGNLTAKKKQTPDTKEPLFKMTQMKKHMEFTEDTMGMLEKRIKMRHEAALERKKLLKTLETVKGKPVKKKT